MRSAVWGQRGHVNVTTRFTHTATGLLAEVTGPNGAVTEYGYDDAGLVLVHSDGAGCDGDRQWPGVVVRV